MIHILHFNSQNWKQMKQYEDAPPLPTLNSLHGGKKELFSETGSFIWTKWRRSKSVFRYRRRIKGFQQIIGMLCICAALTSCCESFRTTIVDLSGTALYWHNFREDRQRMWECVCMSLHTCACLRGCAPCDHMAHVLCWRKQFGLKCHFCQDGKLRIQMYSTVSAPGLFTEPQARPRRHRGYKVLRSFFSSCIVPILNRLTKQNLFITVFCVFKN